MAALAAPEDEPLFEALRALRLDLARQQGVPPYVIFHDTTLLDMARQKPRTKDEMAQITGVGRTKLETYGAAFLAVVGRILGIAPTASDNPYSPSPPKAGERG